MRIDIEFTDNHNAYKIYLEEKLYSHTRYVSYFDYSIKIEGETITLKAKDEVYLHGNIKIRNNTIYNSMKKIENKIYKKESKKSLRDTYKLKVKNPVGLSTFKKRLNTIGLDRIYKQSLKKDIN